MYSTSKISTNIQYNLNVVGKQNTNRIKIPGLNIWQKEIYQQEQLHTLGKSQRIPSHHILDEETSHILVEVLQSEKMRIKKKQKHNRKQNPLQQQNKI